MVWLYFQQRLQIGDNLAVHEIHDKIPDGLAVVDARDARERPRPSIDGCNTNYEANVRNLDSVVYIEFMSTRLSLSVLRNSQIVRTTLLYY